MLPAPVLPAPCGAMNQAPCTGTEGPRGCHGGLVVRGGRCDIKRTILKPRGCGRTGQRPCGVSERYPPCEPGMVLRRGRCAVPEKKKTP